MKKITIVYIDIEGGFGGSSRSLLNIVYNLDKKIFFPIVICKKKRAYNKEIKRNKREIFNRTKNDKYNTFEKK